MTSLAIALLARVVLSAFVMWPAMAGRRPACRRTPPVCFIWAKTRRVDRGPCPLGSPRWEPLNGSGSQKNLILERGL
jgi:hypothetical protein